MLEHEKPQSKEDDEKEWSSRLNMFCFSEIIVDKLHGYAK